MHININTEDLTERDADALRAMLAAYHPAKGSVVMTHVEPVAAPVAEIQATKEPPAVITAPQMVAQMAADRAEQETDDDEVYVPLAEVTLVATAPPEPVVDSNGLPWDERIHASTKTTTADGAWKKKRGVDDETRAAVEAELLGGEDTPPAPETTPAAPGPVQAFAAQAETEAAASVPTPPAPTVPETPAAPTPPAPTATGEPVTALSLVTRLTNARAAGTLDEAAATAVFQEAGVTDLANLLARQTDLDVLSRFNVALTAAEARAKSGV